MHMCWKIVGNTNNRHNIANICEWERKRGFDADTRTHISSPVPVIALHRNI